MPLHQSPASLTDSERAVRETFTTRLTQARSDLRTYAELPNPTPAQTTDTVVQLANCMIWLARIVLRQLDPED